jgi:hypothetical protein
VNADLQLPLAPPDAARLLLQAWLRVNGRPGSGHVGHAGRPGHDPREAPKTFATSTLPVHAVADASVAAIKQAFTDSISTAGITDPASALALIEQNGARLREALATVLLHVVVASGQVHAKTFPALKAAALRSAAPQKSKAAVGVTFDASNPKAVAWARDYAAQLVQDITDDQRASIQALIARALNKDLSRVSAGHRGHHWPDVEAG